MAYSFNPFTGRLDDVGSGGSATTDASLLTSGTLADARLSANVVTLTGTQTLTNKSISSGQITGLSAVATSGSADDLTSGTLPLARLNSLVSLDNVDNNFTAGQSINAPANTSALTASYSVTGANTTPLVSLTGTWNTTGVATGILLNVTDTASAATSTMIDLRRGVSSVFNVSKFGVLTCGQIVTGGNQISCGQINIGFNAPANWNFDTFIQRDGAANTLALRNGTNANTLRCYGSFTDASNGRRLDITSTTGGIFTLTATGNGTGASGNLLKLTAPILLPSASVSLATNGDLAFEATSNTSLTIRYRGSDGTTRSVALTLA